MQLIISHQAVTIAAHLESECYSSSRGKVLQTVIFAGQPDKWCDWLYHTTPVRDIYNYLLYLMIQNESVNTTTKIGRSTF